MRPYRDDEPFYYHAAPVPPSAASVKKTLLVLAGFFVWFCITALGLFTLFFMLFG